MLTALSSYDEERSGGTRYRRRSRSRSPPRRSREDDRDRSRSRSPRRASPSARDRSRSPSPRRRDDSPRRNASSHQQANSSSEREQAATAAARDSQKDCRVYVGNLAFGVKWNDLKDFMRAGGSFLPSSLSLSLSGLWDVVQRDRGIR